MTTNKNPRSRFYHTIYEINTSHPVRAARLDFFGSVLLVCSIGMITKLIQELLAH